jgi:probable F420-dependent oxidoreductase
MATGEKSRRYWGMVQPMPGPIITAMAQQAEAQGLEGVFAAQVHGPPFLPLAVAAAATERIRLASGIAIAAARSPFETAMAALDMDRISNGRFILGLGASVLSWTRGMYGAPEHKPLTHLRETVAAVRHIIAGAHGGLTPFEGQYYRADFEQLQPTAPPVREEIPIWIAALRGPAVRLGAEIADGLIGHPIWSIDWAVDEVQHDLQKGLVRGGRRREDLHLNLWLFVAPGDSPETLEDAKRTVAFYAGVEQYESFFEFHGFGQEARELQGYVKKGEVTAHADVVPDEMARTFMVMGEDDAVRTAIERAWTVADSLCLVPPPYGTPFDRLARYQAEIARLFYGS